MSSLYIVYYEFLMNKIGVFILYQSRHLCYDISCIALVAQLDRAAGFYPAGRGFDSPSTHFYRFTTIVGRAVFCCVNPWYVRVLGCLELSAVFVSFHYFLSSVLQKCYKFRNKKTSKIYTGFFYIKMRFEKLPKTTVNLTRFLMN